MTDRELFEQVLEALDAILGTLIAANEQGVITDTIWFSNLETLFDHIASEADALRERLAQPEQEPIAWLYPEGLAALKAGKCWTAYGTKQDDNNIPIYDAVAPRVEPRASESGAGFESLPASPDKQPEQEPVAWVTGWHDGHCVIRAADPALILPIGAALYTAPQRREWVGLTDEDKAALDEQYGDDTLAHLDAIEQALREKNA